MAIAKSAMGIAPLAASANPDAYSTFYGNLGSHISDITPTKFAIALNGLHFLYSNGDGQYIDCYGVFDMAQNLTVNVGEIPAGFTLSAMAMFLNPFGGEQGYATVEFEWPGGQTAFDSHDNNWHYGDSIDGFSPSWNGNKVTTLLQRYNLSDVKDSFEISGSNIGNLHLIAYGAGDRRIYNLEAIPVSDLIPGINAVGGTTTQFGGAEYDSVVIPLTPINIPENASSVTFHISWNLNGIISRYQGATASANDDIFVLKEGWWNGLYINVTVE
jgi:hypothetical protein